MTIKDIKKISDVVYGNIEDKERMEKMNEVYYAMADYMKEYNAQAYCKFYDEAEDILYTFTKDEAESIVRNMQPYGEKWGVQPIKEFVSDKGIEDSDYKYYLCMNMAYNDFSRTAKKYNLDDPEFYFSLAYDFINDEDGCKHKVEKYFIKED